MEPLGDPSGAHAPALAGTAPTGAPAARTLFVASYNVHAFAGVDGRRDVGRTAEVLAEMGADVVALQEVRCSGDARSTLEALAKRLGVSLVRGLVTERRREGHGNALLSRLPLTRVERIDLSVRGHEPRGALDVAVDTGAEPLRLVATHLGIGVYERRVQVRRLLEALLAREPGPNVLLGDMNEWVRGVGALLPIHRLLGRTPGPRTYPAPLPLFSLDRIWVTPRSRLERMWVHRSPTARRASDHLPIVAQIRVEPANADPGGAAAPLSASAARR